MDLCDVLTEGYRSGHALCTLRLDRRVRHLYHSTVIFHDSLQVVVNLVNELLVQGLIWLAVEVRVLPAEVIDWFVLLLV